MAKSVRIINPVTRNIGRGMAVPTPLVTRIGNWEKVKTMLATLDATVLAGFRAGQLSAAKKLKRAIRRNIRENGGSLHWVPLSEKYMEYKEELGFDPNRMLYMTGAYYWNITIWDNGFNYFVGVKKGVHTRNFFTGGSITLGQIASILEHGSAARNIPARPLWAPTFRQMGGANRIKGLILWHIRNHIRMAYGVTAKITF